MRIFSIGILAICGLFVSAQSVEEVMDKATAALGGEAIAKEIKSTATLGTISIPGGHKGAIEIYTKGAGKVLVQVKIDLPGMKMVSSQGCDGTDCYSNDPNFGLRLLEGQEKETLLLQNDFLAQFNWRELYSKTEYKGSGELDGRKTEKVYVETEQGMKITNHYDAETFLVLKSEGSSKGPMGEMKFTTTFKDYKDVHKGFQVPMKWDMGAMGQVMGFTVDSIDVNVPIPDSKFALPAGLK